jgi:hypothetical protein
MALPQMCRAAQVGADRGDQGMQPDLHEVDACERDQDITGEHDS